jgi:hypothetical protein
VDRVIVTTWQPSPLHARYSKSDCRRILLPINKWIVEAVVVVLIAFLGFVTVTGIQQANRANCCVPGDLMALPPPEPLAGYQVLTAGYLNRTQPERAAEGTAQYIGSDEPSTGPDVVSVNPINHYTWAAVALGSDDHCYAVLVTGQGTYYARFPIGVLCSGRIATPQTVTLTIMPEGY